MRILVLLATYNGESFVEEQLNSIIHQSSVNVSLLIRDDCGNDGTLDFCKVFAKQHQNVHILNHGDKRLGSANNFFTLLKSVTDDFDYVALADQDDIWLKDKLKRAVEKLQIQNADCYSSDVVAFFPNGKQQYIKKSYPQKRFDYLFESPGPGSTFVMRQEFVGYLVDFIKKNQSHIQKIGHHDWFIYAFARSSGYSWVIDDYPGLLYRQHSANERGANKGIKQKFRRFKNLFLGDGVLQAQQILETLRLAPNSAIKNINFSVLGKMKLLTTPFCFRRKKTDSVLFFIVIFLSIFISRKGNG